MRIPVRGRVTVVGLVALVLLVGAGMGLLLRAVGEAREAACRSQCYGQLFYIGVALQNYHDQYGTFPPAAVADASGRPMHSWRVLLLPQMERNDLYQAYNFAQPWDGPDNRRVALVAPSTFVCPTHRGIRATTPYTSVVAVTGPNTPWGRPLATLGRPAGSIVTMVETTADVPWTAPIDLPADAVLTVRGRPTPSLPLPASDHDVGGPGFYVAHADARTTWVPLAGDWRARVVGAAANRLPPATADAPRPAP